MVQYLGVGVVVTYWVGVVVDWVGVVVDSVGVVVDSVGVVVDSVGVVVDSVGVVVDSVGVVVDSVGLVVDGVVATRSIWKKTEGKRSFSDCLPNKLVFSISVKTSTKNHLEALGINMIHFT